MNSTSVSSKQTQNTVPNLNIKFSSSCSFYSSVLSLLLLKFLSSLSPFSFPYNTSISPSSCNSFLIFIFFFPHPFFTSFLLLPVSFCFCLFPSYSSNSYSSISSLLFILPMLPPPLYCRLLFPVLPLLHFFLLRFIFLYNFFCPFLQMCKPPEESFNVTI